MTVFGNIREQREVTECPDHTQGLFDAESIEFVITLGLEPFKVVAAGMSPQSNRQLSNVLDSAEYRLAVGGAYDVTEQATEILDVLPKTGIVFTWRHSLRAPESGESSAQSDSGPDEKLSADVG
jgi:hypothetical protein